MSSIYIPKIEGKGERETLHNGWHFENLCNRHVTVGKKGKIDSVIFSCSNSDVGDAPGERKERKGRKPACIAYRKIPLEAESRK